METKKLEVVKALRDAVVIGVKNIPSIIGAWFLWLLTIWIPYINVGTTIAMILLPVELSYGNTIKPTVIFNSKYRRYIGELFITNSLSGLGTFMGLMFLVIPGIVVRISWSLAPYMLIDKGKNPVDALKASNDATYGNKWRIVGLYLLFAATFTAALGLVATIAMSINNELGLIVAALLMLAWVLLFIPTLISLKASVWSQLKNNVE